MPMVLASLADKRATSVLAVAAGGRGAVSRATITADGTSAGVAKTFLVPTVSQPLDVGALMARVVA